MKINSFATAFPLSTKVMSKTLTHSITPQANPAIFVQAQNYLAQLGKNFKIKLIKKKSSIEFNSITTLFKILLLFFTNTT